MPQTLTVVKNQIWAGEHQVVSYSVIDEFGATDARRTEDGQFTVWYVPTQASGPFLHRLPERQAEQVFYALSRAYRQQQAATATDAAVEIIGHALDNLFFESFDNRESEAHNEAAYQASVTLCHAQAHLQGTEVTDNVEWAF